MKESLVQTHTSHSTFSCSEVTEMNTCAFKAGSHHYPLINSILQNTFKVSIQYYLKITHINECY